ncbi:MAG: hypothetical protein AABX54_01340 [Nanoarchaeota archaeon]
MIKLIGEYELRGSYFLDGQEGSQAGEVSYCSDGKLVGLVRDSNSPLDSKNPRYGNDKLLLGLHFTQEDAIAFLKLVPLKSFIAPVMWYAVSQNPCVGRNELGDIYSGHWQVAMMWTPANDLQAALDRGMPIMDELKGLDVEGLRKIYFNPESLALLRSTAIKMEQEGRLGFKKIN